MNLRPPVNIDALMKEWSEDTTIDSTNVDLELLKIGSLHSKYLNILSQHRLLVKDAEFKYNRMKKLKWEYYSGKMSEEDLAKHGWEPFSFKLKSDIPTYMEADEDIIRIQEKKVYHEEAVKVIEYILNELKQRTWQLRSYIDWEKFVGGQ